MISAGCANVPPCEEVRVIFDNEIRTVVFRPETVRVDALFFFQAEDGIRDLTVTGVQTCALPIFGPREARKVQQVVDKPRHLLAGYLDPLGVALAGLTESVPALFQQCRGETEIGRASCRERV